MSSPAFTLIVFSGSIQIGSGEDQLDVTSLTPNQKVSRAGIAYILQDKSIFPGMTVEEVLWMGGFARILDLTPIRDTHKYRCVTSCENVRG